MRNISYISLKLSYIVFVCVYCIILIFIPTFIPAVIDELYPFEGYLFGFRALFMGGAIELSLFVIAIISLHTLRIKSSIITGIVGIIMLTINSLFLYFLYAPNSDYIIEYGIIPYLLVIILLLIINLLVINLYKFNPQPHVKKIKTLVLELGTKFDRLEIKEISQKSRIDAVTNLKILKNMIKKNEILAEYFTSSRAIVFDQRLNLLEKERLQNNLSFNYEKGDARS